MRITAAAQIAAFALCALACGSAPNGAAASGPRVSVEAAASADQCDRYAEPGTGTAQRLADSLKPGETGCLKGGSYLGTGAPGYVLRFGHGGRRRAPITLISAPGQRAQLRGIVYFPPGANHVQLRGIALDGRHPTRPRQSQNSIQVYANDVVIAGNDITNHGARSCMVLSNATLRPVIRGNTFHDCGNPGNNLFDHAIYLQKSRQAQIIDNVFLRSSGFAIHLYPDARMTRVARNIIWGNGGGVIFGGDEQSGSSGNVVSDNVIGASRKRAELTSSFAGPVGRGNVARDNCLVPGLGASEVYGFRSVHNRVASAATCLGTVPRSLVADFREIDPALVRRALGS